jgi:hypothetical protein
VLFLHKKLNFDRAGYGDFDEMRLNQRVSNREYFLQPADKLVKIKLERSNSCLPRIFFTAQY